MYTRTGAGEASCGCWHVRGALHQKLARVRLSVSSVPLCCFIACTVPCCQPCTLKPHVTYATLYLIGFSCWCCSYKGGIFDGGSCETPIDHAMVRSQGLDDACSLYGGP